MKRPKFRIGQVVVEKGTKTLYRVSKRFVVSKKVGWQYDVEAECSGGGNWNESMFRALNKKERGVSR